MEKQRQHRAVLLHFRVHIDLLILGCVRSKTWRKKAISGKDVTKQRLTVRPDPGFPAESAVFFDSFSRRRRGSKSWEREKESDGRVSTPWCLRSLRWLYLSIGRGVLTSFESHFDLMSKIIIELSNLIIYMIVGGWEQNFYINFDVIE